MKTVLKINSLSKYYTTNSIFGDSGTIKALDGVNLELEEQQTLGIVGESGCGKSTLAKTLIGLEKQTNGSIFINGQNISKLSKLDLCANIQMIFQDPYNSLNPRKKAWELISNPLLIRGGFSKEELFNRAVQIMEMVGLRPDQAQRYPHMFSGGQRQRIGIARALITRPKIIICDEPVSALDVSIQAQIINLLIKLQKELKLSYVFISHDLSVIRYIANKIAVMYLGKIVELGDKEEIFQNPMHPYTRALMSSAPRLDSTTSIDDIEVLSGELPSPLSPPKGCHFHTRCPVKEDICAEKYPYLHSTHKRHVSCHLYQEHQRK